MKFVLFYTSAGLNVPVLVGVEAGQVTPEEIFQVMVDKIEDCTRGGNVSSWDIETLNVFKETIVAWIKACISTRTGQRMSLFACTTKITLHAQTDLKAEGITCSM